MTTEVSKHMLNYRSRVLMGTALCKWDKEPSKQS